ncbi:MAG: hypothetical protein AAB332_06245 [Planctomycetota bacterium]
MNLSAGNTQADHPEIIPKTLKGVVNTNGLTATAWLEYGTTSGGPYFNSNTQTVTGSSDTPHKQRHKRPIGGHEILLPALRLKLKKEQPLVLKLNLTNGFPSLQILELTMYKSKQLMLTNRCVMITCSN